MQFAEFSKLREGHANNGNYVRCGGFWLRIMHSRIIKRPSGALSSCRCCLQNVSKQFPEKKTTFWLNPLTRFTTQWNIQWLGWFTLCT